MNDSAKEKLESLLKEETTTAGKEATEWALSVLRTFDVERAAKLVFWQLADAGWWCEHLSETGDIDDEEGNLQWQQDRARGLARAWFHLDRLA